MPCVSRRKWKPEGKRDRKEERERERPRGACRWNVYLSYSESYQAQHVREQTGREQAEMAESSLMIFQGRAIGANCLAPNVPLIHWFVMVCVLPLT